MNLEGDLADPELGRGLLVQEPAHHEGQDLSFTGRQRRESPLQRVQLASLQARFPVPRERGLDRTHQIRLAERLGEKVHRPCLERAHGARDVAMPRDENDVRMWLAGQLALQVQAVDVRQVDIQDQAPGQVGLGVVQVLGGGPERHDIQVRRAEQLLQCFTQPEIIVHHKDDVILRAHHASLGEIGSVKLKTAPRGLLCPAHSRPSCASTIQRQIARPMPRPSCFVVKKGSKTFSPFSSPLPWSLISISTRFVPSRRDRMPSTLGPFSSDAIASTPLRARLAMTCCICTGSAQIGGRSFARSASILTFLPASSSVISRLTSPITWCKFTSVLVRSVRLNRDRMRLTTWA